MLKRRDALFGGSLVLLCGTTASAAPWHNPIYGCTLPPGEVAGFFALSTESRLYATGNEPMIPKSGDRDFDYALARTLANISQTFDVVPGFAYYDDGDSNNAYATRRVRSNGADGTVLFGQHLLRRLLSGTDNPDLAVACICAHEFGHILQYKRGLDRALGENEPTVKRVELQADFFAGYFAGRRKLERPGFPAAVFALIQYNMGDNMIHNPQHHGTPDERAAAIVRGFEIAYRERKALPEAIQDGSNYVRSL